jgi:DNA transposition AAA+ family ATPase
MSDRTPMDRLTDETRINGASRMIADNTPPEAVTSDDAHAVIQNTLAYIEQSGITRTAIAKSLGVAASTLGQVLNSKYIGAWQQILIDLDRWLEEQQRRDAAPKASSFVWTKVAQEIRTVADMASTLKTIGLVYGPNTSGIGKTMALHAIEATKTGSILVTAETAAASASGLLRSICKALRLGDGGGKHAMNARIKQVLAGTSRLLIVDQIHTLCGARGDEPLYILSELWDMTKSPQLWCGTADLVAYLDRGQAKGSQTLAQIRRRIGISRDLMQRTETQGGDGEPLFTVDEIRSVFAKNKMRLAPDAARYLCELANLPDSGALGACTNLVIMATKINEDDGNALTAQMLRQTHKLLNSLARLRAIATAGFAMRY